MISPKSQIDTAIAEKRAVKIAEVNGGEGQEAWTEYLALRFDAKNPELPLFLIKAGKMDSKYSNKAFNGEGALRQSGSDVENIDVEGAKDWITDNNLNEENLNLALEANEIVQKFQKS